MVKKNAHNKISKVRNLMIFHGLGDVIKYTIKFWTLWKKSNEIRNFNKDNISSKQSTILTRLVNKSERIIKN